MHRLNPRVMAAVQFWMLDEFIAEFIPIPFIDELLMPVVFMLDRRIFTYTQAIVIGKDLFQFSKTLASSTTWMPQVLGGFLGCSTKGLLTNPTNNPDVATGNALISWLIQFLGTPQGIIILLSISTVLSYGLVWIGCWFWGGFINYRLRKIYGWNWASQKFGLWDKGRRVLRPALRLDKWFRSKLRATKLPAYWFYLGMFGLVAFGLIGVDIGILVLTGNYHPAKTSGPTTLPFAGCVP